MNNGNHLARLLVTVVKSGNVRGCYIFYYLFSCRYARWSLDSNMIRMQDVRSLFRYFTATPLSRSVALQFVLTNWKEINDRYVHEN